jgi:hypothetical protein
MGCSETAGTGGSGGDGGDGGTGGSGWSGTSCRGLGGTDITPRCESAEDCADGWHECTTDACADGVCEHVAVEDGTPCGDPEISDESICVRGSCMPACETAEDCETDFAGIEAPSEARARNDCTVAVCASNGFCDLPPVQDGADCAGGTCQGGKCELSGTVLPCNEQGIRNAVAAGGGPYTFDCDGPTTVLTQAQIDIDNDVSLDGEGNLTVDGREVRSGDSVFSLPRWAKAELCGLVVTGAEGEAGIASSGVLTMRNSAVSGNEGGIRNGGIDTTDGSMTMTGVTVYGNICRRADCAGGVQNFGTLTMTNCTVSGNQALSGSQAGGIFNGGTLTMVNSTVTGNTYAPGEEKGDIFGSYGGTITVANSLIDADCYMEDRAVVLSNGYNIESPGDTCGFDQEGDQSDVTAEQLNLGELADNGGSTMTHKPGDGGFDDGSSVAIDAIPADACEVTEDQRGVERPEGEACDVGSVEVEPPCSSASGGCL